MKTELKNRLLDYLAGVFIVCIPFAPEFRFHGAWVTFADIFMIAAVLVWAGALIFCPGYFRNQKFPLLLPFTLLFITFLVSLSNAIDRHLVLKESLKYAVLIPFFYVLVNNLKENIIRKSAAMVTFSISALCIWFLADFILGNVSLIDRLWSRCFLSDQQLNNLAAQIVIGIPFALHLFFKSSSFVLRATGIFCFFIEFLALVLTYSRANWIATSLVIILILFIELKGKGIFAGVILLVVSFLAITVLFPNLELKNRLASTFDAKDQSASSRKGHMMTAASLMKRYPFTGIGLGNYQLAAKKYFNVRRTEMAHNMFLQFGAESGILSLLLLALIVAFTFQTAGLTIKHNTLRGISSAFIAYSLISLTGLIISSQFGDLFIRGIKEYFVLLMAFCTRSEGDPI